jgi:GNAT superfamily N-acetyltransferase
MFTARAATADDHDVLVAMMGALYVEDPSVHTMTADKALRTLQTLASEPIRGKAIVLGMSGATAGYALLASVWSNELGGTVCVVDEIYVAPAHRGAGLATWLVTSLRERTTPWFTDAVAFELEVSPANTRARALYERMGFRAKRNTTLRAPVVVEHDPAER